MGTLLDFDGILNSEQDSHIFQEDTKPYQQVMETKLSKCKVFGTYRNDSASGKPWDELKPFEADDTVTK